MLDPHGSRMALANQRCWYGSLLTDILPPVQAGDRLRIAETPIRSPRVSPPTQKRGATALGLNLPPTLLALADELIE